MSELFPVEQVASESPMRRWMRKHAIELDMVLNDPRVPNDRVCQAKIRNGNGQHNPKFFGATPEAALAQLAEAYELTLWLEEDPL